MNYFPHESPYLEDVFSFADLYSMSFSLWSLSIHSMVTWYIYIRLMLPQTKMNCILSGATQNRAGYMYMLGYTKLLTVLRECNW